MSIIDQIHQLADVELDGVDFKDHPDYCDAYLSSATLNGVELTESQLDEINSSDAGASFVNENCYEHVVSSYGY
jgi:uncharacterized protein YjbI with pentapeptide repeats